MMTRARLLSIQFAGIAAICAVYFYTQQPIVTSVNETEGVTVQIVGRRLDGFGGIPLLNEFLWGHQRTETVKLTDGKIIISLNRAVLLDKGMSIQKRWSRYEANHKALISADEQWDSEMEATFRLLHDSPKDKIADTFLSRAMDAHLVHELRHAKDGVDGFDPLNSEIRAYLTEIMSSPSGLRNLEMYSKAENRHRFEPHYRNAADNILSALMNLHGLKTKRQLHSQLTDRQLAEGAKVLFARWYPNG